MKTPIGIKDRHGREICDGDILRLGTTPHHHDVVVKKVVKQKEVCYGQGSYGVETFVGYYFDGYYGLPTDGEVVGQVDDTEGELPIHEWPVEQQGDVGTFTSNVTRSGEDVRPAIDKTGQV